MVLGKANANRVVLVAGDLLMEQKADMNLFYITKHQLFNTNRHRKGVAMEITFKRKTRSSWLNCALRDDEVVYWVSIGRTIRR